MSGVGSALHDARHHLVYSIHSALLPGQATSPRPALPITLATVRSDHGAARRGGLVHRVLRAGEAMPS